MALTQGWCPKCQRITEQVIARVGKHIETTCHRCNTLLSRIPLKKGEADGKSRG
jgi:hypothetical protein